MAFPYKELFEAKLLEDYMERTDALQQGRNVSYAVDEYNVLHLGQVVGEPDVLVDNTTFPIPMAGVNVKDVPIATHRFDTEVTKIQQAGSERDNIFDMIQIHLSQHAKALFKKTKRWGNWNVSPADDTNAELPLMKTTGSVLGSFRQFTPEDLQEIEKYFDDREVPTENRVLMLNTTHKWDLIATGDDELKKVLRAIGTNKSQWYNTLRIFVQNDTTTYDANFEKITNWKSTGMRKSSLFFDNQKIAFGVGSTEIIKAEAEPFNRMNTMGAAIYYTAEVLGASAGKTGVGVMVSDS